MTQSIPATFRESVKRQFNVVDTTFTELAKKVSLKGLRERKHQALEKVNETLKLLPKPHILSTLAGKNYLDILTPLLPKEKKNIELLQAELNTQSKESNRVNELIKKWFLSATNINSILKKPKEASKFPATFHIQKQIEQNIPLTLEELGKLDGELQKKDKNYQSPSKKTDNQKEILKNLLSSLASRENQAKEVLEKLRTLLVEAQKAGGEFPIEEPALPTGFKEKGDGALLAAAKLDAELPRWKRLQALGIVFSAVGASGLLSIALIRFRLLQKGLESFKETRIAGLSAYISRFLNNGTTFLQKIDARTLFFSSSLLPVGSALLLMGATIGRSRSQHQAWDQRVAAMTAYYSYVKLTHIKDQPPLTRTAALKQIETLNPSNFFVKKLTEHLSN